MCPLGFSCCHVVDIVLNQIEYSLPICDMKKHVILFNKRAI